MEEFNRPGIERGKQRPGLEREHCRDHHEQEQAAAWAREASFVPGVSGDAEVPAPRRTPATRRQVEREEA